METAKNEMANALREAEENLREYCTFLEAAKGKSGLESDLEKTDTELTGARNKYGGVADKLLKLSGDNRSLIASADQKTVALGSLETKYSQVIPMASSEPMGVAPKHRLPSALEEMIDTYLLALGDRVGAKEKIKQHLAIIEGKNGLRFTTGQDEDTTIRQLMEAIEGTDEYIKQQENCQKAVSQEIGALLKGLTDRFDTFEHEIARFNRQMNARKISNINRIEFVVDSDNDILRAVKEIVDQDSIFSEPERVHRAVRRLDDLITEKKVKLSLESLFNLGIRVELEGGTVTSSFNDANIQSTGTGLTVKIILNVMLLNRLLFIKDGQVVNIPIYIDEAGQIDPANQQTLIEQCLPAGFVPVFASVEAQATADYWIGLNEVDGRIYVDQEDWFRLSKLDEAFTEAAVA